MAYKKKTETTEDGVATKETATSVSASASVETDKDAEIKNLKAQLEQLTQMFATMMSNQNKVENKTNSLTDEVKIIHLLDNPAGITTHVELSNITLDFGSFGEERTLDRRQAEELVGKKRSWFEEGILAIGSDNKDFADRNSVKTIDNYAYVNKNFLENIANLNAVDLEAFYRKVSQAHKEFIIGYFKRKIFENQDMRFQDPQKIEMLNRVTAEEDPDHRGAMEVVIMERNNRKK